MVNVLARPIPGAPNRQKCPRCKKLHVVNPELQIYHEVNDVELGVIVCAACFYALTKMERENPDDADVEIMLIVLHAHKDKIGKAK